MERHQTIKNIVNKISNVNVINLLVEDMLSNYVFEYGDEDYLSSELLNKIEAVVCEMKNDVNVLHTAIANSHRPD